MLVFSLDCSAHVQELRFKFNIFIKTNHFCFTEGRNIFVSEEKRLNIYYLEKIAYICVSVCACWRNISKIVLFTL